MHPSVSLSLGIVVIAHSSLPSPHSLLLPYLRLNKRRKNPHRISNRRDKRASEIGSERGLCCEAMARERKAHYEASFFVVGQAGGRVSEVEDGEMELVGILGETMENSLLIPNDLSSGERERERAGDRASERASVALVVGLDGMGMHTRFIGHVWRGRKQRLFLSNII